jgi:hypothetical protein
VIEFLTTVWRPTLAKARAIKLVRDAEARAERGGPTCTRPTDRPWISGRSAMSTQRASISPFPRAHRPQREVPARYALHRLDLDPLDVTEIEGVPVVTLERAIREGAAGNLAADLLEQAIRHGREHGLLSDAQADALAAEIGTDRVAVGRA